MVPIWVSEPTGRPLPRRACSTPLMNVEATAPRPTSRMPRRPSAGWIGLGLSSTKSFGSKITPLWRPSDMSGICHWAGTRPVLAQCSIVLCRLPSKAASALWPPKRLMIRSAAFVLSSIAGILTIFSLSCKCAPERGRTTYTPVQGFDRMGRGHSKHIRLLLLVNALRAHA